MYNQMYKNAFICKYEQETKRMKRVLSLILCAFMLVSVLSLASCSSKDDSDDGVATDAATNASTDAVTSGSDSNVLVMATNAEFPPYEYYEDDAIVGIDAEIAAAIADKLGMELKIEDMKFESIIPSVVSGGADMALAGMTVTEERLNDVDFSSSYATGVQVVIVKENSGIETIDDLSGKKIGVQLATTGDIYASDTVENGGFGEENVVKYNKGADAVMALQGGDVDAVIIDNEPAKAFVAANEGLTILSTEYAVEEYAIAVNKGNTELLNKINTALEELTAEGKIDEIISKYINAD
jgi:polar amino acid transport system substrate-binding protein